MYKIGWKSHGKWLYINVGTKAEMLAEVADKTTLSDKISVRVIKEETHGNIQGDHN